jgi:hypothetical protein
MEAPGEVLPLVHCCAWHRRHRAMLEMKEEVLLRVQPMPIAMRTMSAKTHEAESAHLNQMIVATEAAMMADFVTRVLEQIALELPSAPFHFA